MAGAVTEQLRHLDLTSSLDILNYFESSRHLRPNDSFAPHPPEGERRNPIPGGVLIANRGVVALEALETCVKQGRRAGILYNDADKDTLAVQIATELDKTTNGFYQAINVGPRKPTETYANPNLIAEKAKENGYGGVFVGWGFGAEDPHFAETIIKNDLRWVGTSPESMRQLAHKENSLARARSLDIPVLPRVDGAQLKTPEEIEAAIEKIGFPAILKANTTGAGMGNCIVRTKEELSTEWERWHTLFKNNGGYYLEKYLEGAKHIEAQILVDNTGKVAVVCERECSVQNPAFQKRIEQAPPPAISDETKTKIKEYATLLVGGTDYSGAGTVEFLLGPDGQLYYLEMNTRLQVEHPVSEVTKGRSILRSVFDIEEGCLVMDNPPTDTGLVAMELRWFAKEPGKILKIKTPKSPFLRVDPAYGPGGVVPEEVDKLIALLNVVGTNWSQVTAEAIRICNYIEKNYAGVKTNIADLKAMLQTPQFQNHTHTVDFSTNFFAERDEAEPTPAATPASSQEFVVWRSSPLPDHSYEWAGRTPFEDNPNN